MLRNESNLVFIDKLNTYSSIYINSIKKENIISTNNKYLKNSFEKNNDSDFMNSSFEAFV